MVPIAATSQAQKAADSIRPEPNSPEALNEQASQIITRMRGTLEARQRHTRLSLGERMERNDRSTAEHLESMLSRRREALIELKHGSAEYDLESISRAAEADILSLLTGSNFVTADATAASIQESMEAVAQRFEEVAERVTMQRMRSVSNELYQEDTDIRGQLNHRERMNHLIERLLEMRRTRRRR